MSEAKTAADGAREAARPQLTLVPGGRTQPKLAVVITCFNYETYVEAAILSVQAQGRDDVQLVVVDDGSTDGSWAAINRTGVAAFRIANGGQRVACLHGLDQTTAPFVLFLDADDALKPSALATIIAHLDAGVAKLQFPLTRIDGAGLPIGGAVPALADFRTREALATRVLRTGAYATPPTSGNVFRRDVCELLREADYDRAVDGVILFAAPFFGDVVSLSQELGLYRIHGLNDSGLGRPADAAALDRDIRRFVQRTAHLRRFLDRIGRAGDLVPTDAMFFVLERRFSLAIASGRRPPLAGLPRLLARLWQDDHPPRTRATMTAFFLLAALLPNGRARRVMAFRFDVGRRSARDLLRAIFGAER
ncbi:MAG: glycosyltransferase [Piscinibacter sp.]